MNLCYKVGNLDATDVSFFVTAILNFSGGFAAFKCLDTKLSGRWSCTTAAPVIFALFALADILRARSPSSRWHMIPLAFACGMVNSVSAEKAKLVTMAVTGHYQGLSSLLADALCKGLTAPQRRSAFESVRMVAAFCSAIAVGMAASNARGAPPALARAKFTAFGALYAAALVLHELPADALYRRGRPAARAE